ncbi:GDSL-type esterase/lipase family protein [Hellea balneolensis]|uniref:GDSL-type esterase/lipase family protein n=1 Tax=Hellea balneolensis TaxID=287478 RepID=UPI0003FBB024|nr:GDSL-type esterase/lipase family protein [Hellea balneolensis]
MSNEGDERVVPIEFSLLDRKILFLGDSITAGFGVGGDTKDCANTPALHSPTESYAMLSADMLSAEPQLIAISGRGVVHNWDANPSPVIPAQIDLALPDAPGTKWDHSLFMPDVVVTTVGTNDWSVINPGEDKFRAGYRDMLSDLRSRFPDAHIVTVTGPLLTGEKAEAARDGIDGAMEALSDSNMSTLNLSLFDGELRWSCNYHPGRNSMRKMANKLSAHIAQIKGWSFTPLELPPPNAISPPDYMLPGGKAHFRARLPEIDAQPLLEGGIMLAGDSITEGWLGYDIDLGAAVSNHGIGWDTVTGLKLRLPQMLAHSPDKVFILIGTNDIGYDRDPELMADELLDIVSAIKEKRPKTEIYIQSLLPRELSAMAAVKEINQHYARIALQSGVNYIDLTPAFAAPNGTLKADLTYDGLHLNQTGYKVWAETLKPYIRP